MHTPKVSRGVLLFLTSILFGLVPAAMGCAAHAETDPTPEASPQSTPAITTDLVIDYNYATSIADLVSKSDVVAIVVPDGTKGTSQSKSDLAINSTYGIYRDTVEEYLKGSGPDSFEVAQVEQTTYYNPDRPGASPVTAGDLRPPFISGERYMLFVHPSKTLGQGVYISDVEPSRWLLTDGTAKPESPSYVVPHLFPQRPESQLRSEVISAR